MMVLFVFTSMTITMICPAQRPLRTPLQKKPLIGHVGEIQYKSQKRHRDDRSIEHAGAFQLLRETARPACYFRQRGCVHSIDAALLRSGRSLSETEVIPRH
jgi:hypothetical protein